MSLTPRINLLHFVPHSSVGTTYHGLGRHTLDEVMLKQLKAVRIFPNPVTGQLFVDTQENVNYTIINLQRQVLKSGQTKGKEAIDVSHLLPGRILLQGMSFY